MKEFLRLLPLSRFLAKTLTSQKSVVQSRLKKLQLPPLIYKINTHNQSTVGS